MEAYTAAIGRGGLRLVFNLAVMCLEYYNFHSISFLVRAWFYTPRIVPSKNPGSAHWGRTNITHNRPLVPRYSCHWTRTIWRTAVPQVVHGGGTHPYEVGYVDKEKLCRRFATHASLALTNKLSYRNPGFQYEGY